jgi:hypothetical protein
LVRNPEAKRHLGRPKRRWKENTKTNLKEIECEYVDWTELFLDMDQWRALVNTVINIHVQ